MKTLLWPLSSELCFVTSPFGKRRAPKKGASTEHNGIDVRCPQGHPVSSPASGKISRIFDHHTGGLTVWIDHADGIQTRYCHLETLFCCGEGDHLVSGERFAFSGGTPGTPGAGTSTGAHLHLSVLRDGVYIDPLSIAWVDASGHPIVPEVRR